MTPAGRGKATTTDLRTPAERHRTMCWAQRLKRVCGIEIETCERCGSCQPAAHQFGGIGEICRRVGRRGGQPASRLEAIRLAVDGLTDRAPPRVATVLELEASVREYDRDVQADLAGDSAAAGRLLENAGDIGRNLAAYQQLAETPLERELAGRFTAIWLPFHTLNEGILAAGKATPDQSVQLFRLRQQLGDVVRKSVQGDASVALDTGRSVTRDNSGAFAIYRPP